MNHFICVLGLFMGFAGPIINPKCQNFGYVILICVMSIAMYAIAGYGYGRKKKYN